MAIVLFVYTVYPIILKFNTIHNMGSKPVYILCFLVHLQCIVGKTASPDPVLDCAIKELAWNRSKALLPERGDLLSVFDALQLKTKCNLARPSTSKQHISPEWTPNHHSSIVVFVHPTKGSDHNKGTKHSPLASLLAARNLCRQKRKEYKRKEVCTVFLMEGVHELAETLNLSPEDSGIHFIGEKNSAISGGKSLQVKWQLYESGMRGMSGQNPIFYDNLKPGESSKAVKYFGKLNYSKLCLAACNAHEECTSFVYFGPGSGMSSMCYFRLDGHWNPEPQNNCVSGKKVRIYVTDLSKFSVKPFNSLFINGRRAVRARFPNGNPEISGLHTVPTGYVKKAEKWLPPIKTPPAIEINIDSPFRNNTFFTRFRLAIGGSLYQFDPPRSYWGVEAPYDGYAYEVPSGLVYNESLEFANKEWKQPHTGILHTQMYYHWGGWQFSLDGRNMSSNTLTWTKGGFQFAQGATSGTEWYLENIFEELDEAGEWFFDDETNKLYYFPNQTLPQEITVAQMESLISVKGSQLHPVENVTFVQVTFTKTSSTFMEKYEVPGGGDWTIHRNGALFIEGAQNVLVDHCLFSNIGGTALFLSNYIRNATISNNEFVWIGESGIAAVGSSNLIDGTTGDQPRGTKIISNLAHEFGIYGKQTAAYFQSVACQTLIKGNVFFNAPRSGIDFNDHFGGGNQITDNVMFNLVRETLDHGPFNSWDRQPYLTKVKDGVTLSMLQKESTMTCNFIINNFQSWWPIDHDDGSAYFNDQYNYLVYGGFKNYLGHSKISKNNVYVYPDGNRPYGSPNCAMSSGASTGPRASGWGDEYTDNICIVNMSMVYGFPSCKVKDMQYLIPFTARNKFYTPGADIVVKCENETWSLKEFQAKGYDIGSTVSDLVGTKEIIKWGNDLFKFCSKMNYP